MLSNARNVRGQGAAAAAALALLKLYRGAVWRLRPYSGLTRLSRHRLVHRLFRLVSPSQPATLRDGTPVQVDIDDYHGRILWLFGTNDFKVEAVSTSLCRAGDVFLDIGANHGAIGLAARHALGPDGHVHLFEPQPRFAAMLRETITAAHLVDTVTVHEVALLDRDDILTMRVPETHSGKATVMEHGKAFARGTEITLEGRDTRRYIAPLVSGRRFGVKIDIEGAEPNVLPGLIETQGMKFCVFEWDRNQKFLLDKFFNSGWRIFDLSRSPLWFSARRVTHFEEWRTFHDFVAMPAATWNDRAYLTLSQLRSAGDLE